MAGSAQTEGVAMFSAEPKGIKKCKPLFGTANEAEAFVLDSLKNTTVGLETRHIKEYIKTNFRRTFREDAILQILKRLEGLTFVKNPPKNKNCWLITKNGEILLNDTQKKKPEVFVVERPKIRM